MWVEFVVGSRPCSERFSPGTSVFLSPQNQRFQIPVRSEECSSLNTLTLKKSDLFFVLFKGQTSKQIDKQVKRQTEHTEQANGRHN